MYQLLIFTCFVLSQAFEQDKCRVLVLEGGGDRGAYLAGAFNKMVEVMPAQEVNYDIITGISAGGLNAGALSTFERGQEKEAADFLSQIWHSVKRTDIWETWGYIYEPIFHEPALVNSAPEQEYLTKMLEGRTFKRDVLLGATNIQTGQLERFSFSNVTTEEAVQIMMLTSASPVIFQPRTYKNQTYLDGGASTFMDVIGGINYCKDKGFFEQDIIVDTVMCVGKNMNISGDQIPKNTAESMLRLTDLVANQLIYKDMIEAKNNYEDVYFRQIITPDFFIAGSVMFLFDTNQMNQMYDQGQTDAAKSWEQVIQSQNKLSLTEIQAKIQN